MNDKPLTPRSSAGAIAKFRQQARQLASIKTQGRLIFALDATASRQPTWDQACHLQGEMFIAAANGTTEGKLSVQLVWYRGFAEFRAEPWANDPSTLLKQMHGVQCMGGMTQLERVLRHALTATRKHRINALVFVGDCIEEPPDPLYALAGQCKLLGLKAFMFQEGRDRRAADVFGAIARLSGGAYASFDSGSAAELRKLLRAVAAYARGGRQAVTALAARDGGLTRLLSDQLD